MHCRCSALQTSVQTSLLHAPHRTSLLHRLRTTRVLLHRLQEVMYRVSRPHPTKWAPAPTTGLTSTLTRPPCLPARPHWPHCRLRSSSCIRVVGTPTSAAGQGRALRASAVYCAAAGRSKGGVLCLLLPRSAIRGPRVGHKVHHPHTAMGGGGRQVKGVTGAVLPIFLLVEDVFHPPKKIRKNREE